MLKTASLSLIGITLLCIPPFTAHAGHAPPITEVVSFGDSLSDCGAYGFKPTTAPALTWNQQLARHYGADLQPNETGRIGGAAPETKPGGLCYAQGGARTTLGAPAELEKLPISGSVQLDHFLTQHGDFADGQLVTVYLGANDILIPFADLNGKMGAEHDAGGQAKALDAVRQSVELSAKQVGELVQRMLDHKAQRIVVLNMYDLGVSGFPGANPVLSGLADDFNRVLKTALPYDPRVLQVDTHALIAAVTAQPEKYGITHAPQDDACTTPRNLGPACYADSSHWTSPDADRTHLLIGMVHFTGVTEKLLAEYVIHQIDGNRRKTAP